MTPQEFKEKMKELESYDTEYRHIKADELMCQLLISLGYEEGIEIYSNFLMWYS